MGFQVPVYLSECWERNAGQDLGRLVIKPSNGRTDVTFTSNPVFTKAIGMNFAHIYWLF